MRFFGLEGAAMKQGTQIHPKFKSLAKALKLNQYEAVGILESIWMMACQFAGDDGDLSRFNPQEIADWMDWRGDSKELIDALVACRWLDSIGGSLKVHDWLDHRPHYLKDRSRKQQAPKRTGKASAGTNGFQEIPGSSGKAPGVSDPSLVQSSPVQSSQKSNGTGKRFTPPSVDEVQRYAKEVGLTIDPEAFVDHYQSVDWMVGRKRMKDWQAAVRKWSRNQNNFRSTSTIHPPKEELKYVN
jgi:hypothetical protein